MPRKPNDRAPQTAHDQAVTPPHALHPADTTEFPWKKMEWLPDWRDAAAYPPGDTSNEQLAWELLRRNRYFQQDCLDATTRNAREEVCLKWGLRTFKSFWEPYSAEAAVAKRGLIKPAANSEVGALVTKSTAQGPNQLILHLNPQALAVSVAERDQQFKALRDFIEGAHVSSVSAARSRPRSAWASKIAKYLRVVDALSLNPPVSRTQIAEQLHHDGLILTSYEKVRSDEEIVAQLKLLKKDAQLENQLVLRNNLRGRMAKKYSREVGSQIGRAYNLIYCDGYRFLLGSDSTMPSARSSYKKKRKPFGGGWDHSIFDETPAGPTPSPRRGARSLNPETSESW